MDEDQILKCTKTNFIDLRTIRMINMLS